MSHIYHKIWIHLIWSTKDRFPYLNKEIKNNVIFHIKEKGGNEGIYVDTINGLKTIFTASFIVPRHKCLG